MILFLILSRRKIGRDDGFGGNNRRPGNLFFFVFVRKRGGYKVSAKEVINRRNLQTFHADLSKYLEQQLGFPVNVLNEATKEGNRSIEQLKRQNASDTGSSAGAPDTAEN